MKSSCSDTTGGYFVTWMRILAVGRPLAETERIASPAFSPLCYEGYELTTEGVVLGQMEGIE